MPRTSQPHHGLPPGKEPPLLPPDLKVDPAKDRGKGAVAAGHPAAGARGGIRPAALADPPRATNLVLLPGLVAGDTSLQLYFDAPADGWTQGTVSLFTETDLTTPVHTAPFQPGQLIVCDSPARYCFTMHNGEGWGLLAGTRYVATVTLTTADGQSTDSDRSRAVAARALPVPPAVPADQVRGSGGMAGGRTGIQPVLRGYGVNAATGAQTVRSVDATIANAYDVNASALRTYSSADTDAGLLGIGWQFGYEARVHPKADNPDDAVFVDEDGSQSVYTRNADGSYAAPPGVRSTLRAKSGGGWEVTTPAQQKLSFDTNGRLRSILNPRGKGVTVGYDGSERLATVTDAGGRVLRITTKDPGRISTVTLPDGRTVTYAYTGDHLASVRDPDGAVTTYGYDGSGRLASITDPLGHKQLTIAYDVTSGRVSSQRDVFGKQYLFEWRADIQESKVTDPDGVSIRDGFQDNVLLYSRNGNADTQIYRYDAKLNLQVTADPLGSQVEAGFDGGGNVTSQTVFGAADPVTANATFDAANNLRTRTDGLGHLTTFTYNDFHQPVTGTDGEGHVTTFGYDDATGLLKTITDPLGHVTAYDYDVAGDLVALTDPTTAKTAFTYDATGRVTSSTDARGDKTTYDVYDGLDRIRRMTDPLGHFQLWDYDNAGRLVKQTDANANPVSYVYNDANQLTRLIDPDLRTTDYAYTGGGRLKTVTDGAGDVTTYTYDSAGRLASQIAPRGKAAGANPADFTTSYGYDFNGNLTSVSHPYPGGGTVQTRYTYDSNDLLTSATDGLGRTTRYGYDLAGNPTTVTDPLGHTRTTAYDRDNRPTTVTDPRGKSTTFAYDAAGNLIRQTTATGAVTTYGYDAADRITSLTPPRGNLAGADPAAFRTTYAYDPTGNLTAVTDALGHVSKAEFDAANRVTRRTDPNGHVTRFGYDNANRLTRIWGPDSTNDTQVTVNDYDHSGRLIDRIDPLGFVNRYTYDAAGRLATTTDPIGNRRELTYDPDGDVTAIVTARGTSSGFQAGRDAGTIVQRYDSLNRLRERDLGNGPAYSYGYDGASHLTNLADAAGEEVRGYDAAGYLTSVTRGPAAFGYGYDASGNLTSRTMPDGSTQGYTYDDDNRPDTYSTPLGQTRYGYDADSNVRTITEPGGTTQTRTYDNTDGLATLAVTGPQQQPITAYTLTRDKVGNPTRVDTTAGTATRSDAFTYDKADRLTAMCFTATSCSTATSKLSFSYDLVGDRLTKSRSGSGSYTEHYTYNAADQLTSRAGGPDGTVTYDYDQDGNTVRAGSAKLAYDLDDQLTSVDNGTRRTTYATDAAGNRLSADTGASSGGTTTRTSYQWDVNNPLPMLVAEQTPTERRSYLYHPDGSPLAQQVGAIATLLNSDAFGNTTALSDPAGTVRRRYTLSDPFGGLDAVGSGPDTRLGFQGQYKDPLSGDYDLRARDYTTVTGRFESVDPMGSGTDQPAVSPYAYANDNPLTGADPSGLCDWWDLQCHVVQKVYDVWQYETTQHPTAQQREDQFGFGVLRAIPETIDGTWNGIVDVTNWANRWSGKPTIPDNAKLHLTQSYDKFVGTNFHVDTSSPYYTGGDFVGQVALLFIPVGGEEAGLGDVARGILSKLRLPKWFPKGPKGEPRPPGTGPHVPGADPHAPGADPHAPGADPHSPGTDTQVPGGDGDVPGGGEPSTPASPPKTGTKTPTGSGAKSGGGAGGRTGAHAGNTTRQGIVRTNAQDWRRVRDGWDTIGYGDILSPANRALIARGRTPVVDDAWVGYFPGDAGLMGQRISIHHIGGGPIGVPLPYSRHLGAHMPGGFRYNPGGPGMTG